jgi:hypothetical protein
MNFPAMNSHLLLPPDLRFDFLCKQLADAGWALADTSTRQSIAPGEPERATFERQGTARLSYTFQPACRLRVLDRSQAGAAALPPGLPPVDSATVRQWLEATDERTLLRGILAAGVLLDITLADAVSPHVLHPRPPLAQAAARVVQQLSDAAGMPLDPQAQALAAVQVLKVSLAPLLQSLSHDRGGKLMATLRPRPEDYARAFREPAAAFARTAYEAAWEQDPPRIRASVGAARLQMDLSPAGMLAEDNILSQAFPGGYRTISHLLDPHRVWARWKYVAPGDNNAGMAYDGLVWLDDHWAWLPKPYRMLAPLIQAGR